MFKFYLEEEKNKVFTLFLVIRRYDCVIIFLRCKFSNITINCKVRQALRHPNTESSESCFFLVIEGVVMTNT